MQSYIQHTKARIPMPNSVERNSSQKKHKHQSKSRSKERKSIGPVLGSKERIAPGSLAEESKLSQRPQVGQNESTNNLMLQNQVESVETTTAFHQQEAIGSGLKQPTRLQKPMQRSSQDKLQIPNQRPIYRLLQAFKLQQYAKNFDNLGYGDDVYKLTMITHRKKQELIDSIDLLPGHKQRIFELFRRIDLMYPRQNVSKTIDNAMRVSSRQSHSRASGAASSVNNAATTQDSSINGTSERPAYPASRESVNTAQSLAPTTKSGLPTSTAPLLQTQPVGFTQTDYANLNSGIPPPTQFPAQASNYAPSSTVGITSGGRRRSPPSQGKPMKRKSIQQQSSLQRKFNELDPGTRSAINQSFLMNLRSGKTQVTTVSDALKQFYGKAQEAKKSVINKIFADKSGSAVHRSAVKPHPSLAQNNNAGSQGAVGSEGGFGLGKFVKVQKGTSAIDKYRSQIVSQGSAGASTTTNKQRQTRTEAQGPRRAAFDKRAKNSNSSSDSKPGAIYRKGSHPAATRKKNTSNSSERKETQAASFGLLAPNLPSGKGSGQRQQPMTQTRQHRVTSHSRIQIQQNSNFMIAPSSSRGAFNSKIPKQPAMQKGGSLMQAQSSTDGPSGRTRLHRVRSATGVKDLQPGGASGNTTITATNTSSAQPDYFSNSKPKPRGSTITTGQHAAIKRVQLHRQRSAKKQISTTQPENERVSTTTTKKQKPPTTTSGSSIPAFIQNSNSGKLQRQSSTTNNIRRRVSRERGNIDLNVSQRESGSVADPSSSLTHQTFGQDVRQSTRAETSNDYRGPLGLLKRASSMGVGNRANPEQTASPDKRNKMGTKSYQNEKGTNGTSNAGEPVSQSVGFSGFKLMGSGSPDPISDIQQETTALPAITTTVQKVNQKGQDLANSSFKSTNSAINHPGTATGKPPMSNSKRSNVASSSKAESLKTVESVHHSPNKQVRGSLTGGSPARPLILEPIQNPPTLESKPDTSLSKTKVVEVMPPPDEELPQEEEIKREEINIKWTPLLDKSEKLEARDYGYSFGSKKVAMGPGFMNLRFMCHCLARAIKRHLEFSKGEHWFLQDLQQEQDDIDLEFSYQLPADLKLTLNPKGVQVNSDDEDDVNPFQREDASPVRDIETMDIEVETADKARTQQNSKATSKGRSSATLGEPEPEIIRSSDGEEDNSQRLSAFNNKNPFTSNKPVNTTNQNRVEDEIGEDLDEDNFEAYEQDFEAEDPEEQSIKEMRKEEIRKSVFEKDEKRIAEYLNARQVTELQEQLKSKDQQIAQLTQMVQHGAGRSEILAISPAGDEEREPIPVFDKGVKMDRADWLMAQVDLDPIESHGSMEASTTKFKSLHGKRFINSANGGNAHGIEDSRTSNTTKPAIEKKKKSEKSYESAFVDVSEDKMREFAMSQLRHFDVRMEYDNLIFNEDQFIPMPSEKYIADYCKYVTIACKMENEIPIVCLVYLEKLLLGTGILLNKWNWRRLVLICLCLASKIWDDDSLENVHFPKVMSDVTNYEINKLEQLFLEFIDYKLVIKGAEYAKYYFILRTMADDLRNEKSAALASISPFENTRRNKSNAEEWAEFPLRAPISAEKMIELQRQEAKAEVYLKERHEREFLNAYIGNKGGSRKDQTRHPSLLLDRTM